MESEGISQFTGFREISFISPSLQTPPHQQYGPSNNTVLASDIAINMMTPYFFVLPCQLSLFLVGFTIDISRPKSFCLIIYFERGTDDLIFTGQGGSFHHFSGWAKIFSPSEKGCSSIWGWMKSILPHTKTEEDIEIFRSHWIRRYYSIRKCRKERRSSLKWSKFLVFFCCSCCLCQRANSKGEWLDIDSLQITTVRFELWLHVL